MKNTMERIYNKLVRDYILNIIEAKGEEPVIKILSDDEYKTELEKKLNEEYKEVLESSDEARVEELADMLEVIRALAKVEGKTLYEVIAIANEKSSKRGAFDKKIFLEKVIETK